MANNAEMTAFIEAVMEHKNLEPRMAYAWALGYVTEYVPAEKLEIAIKNLKENK